MKPRITFYPTEKTRADLQELRRLGVPYSTAINLACQQGKTLASLLSDWRKVTTRVPVNPERGG